MAALHPPHRTQDRAKPLFREAALPSFFSTFVFGVFPALFPASHPCLSRPVPVPPCIGPALYRSRRLFPPFAFELFCVHRDRALREWTVETSPFLLAAGGGDGPAGGSADDPAVARGDTSRGEGGRHPSLHPALHPARVLLDRQIMVKLVSAAWMPETPKPRNPETA